MDIRSINRNVNYKNLPLIFLDLETTGLEVQKCEIIEIGAIRVNQQKPFEIEGELSLKVKPLNIKNADKESLRITGFTEERWKDALDLKTALKMLEEFSKRGILVGYNISFDWAFLHKAYFEIGQEEPFHYHRLDVLAMAYYKLYKKNQIKKFSLSAVCEELGINRTDKHQAFADTKVTYLVFKRLMEII